MQIASIFIMPNGMVAVIDGKGKQRPKYQGFLLDLNFQKLKQFVGKNTKIYLRENERLDWTWWHDKREALR